MNDIYSTNMSLKNMYKILEIYVIEGINIYINTLLCYNRR